MKHPIYLFLASVLCAGFLAGCSNEVQTAHHGCCCPTDPIASFGQDIYYGRYTSCWSDGHQVPITFATRCDYYDQSMTVVNSPSPSVSVSTAPNPNVSVSIRRIPTFMLQIRQVPMPLLQIRQIPTSLFRAP